MISTFADLLEAFRQKESQLLDKQNINHAPTIGRMYEGLTRRILEKTLPKGLDLKVVSGFITNDRGELSKQIDCMLVISEGEKIPYTDDYKYHIKDVVVVIEVKKNLYTNELDSAYQNLISVRNLLYANAFPENQLFNDAHRSILRSDPNTYEDITKLPNTVLAVLILMENSGTNEGIDINSPEFTGEFKEFAHSLDDSIEYLRKVGLVSVENGFLRFLTRECKIAVLPDGRVIADEDVSGRLSAWLAKFTEEFNSQV